MDKHLVKTVKLIAEFLACDKYEFVQNKKCECSRLCIENGDITFSFDSEYIIFKKCANISDQEAIRYLHDILGLYLKTFKTYSQECINPVTTHELKGILSTAMLSLEMLSKYDFDSDDRSKLTKQAFEAVTKSIEVFEEMLQIEKLQYQNETKTLEVMDVDILEIIEKITRSLSTSIEAKKISLSIKDHTNKKAIINGSSFWLERAIFNLISNAVKYNLKNGILKIEMKWKKQALLLAITNSSTQIDEKDRQRLFEKFQTSKDTQTTGTGIGLALVKAVADTHGASIDFENDSVGLMTFYFELPKKIKTKYIDNPMGSLAAAFIAVIFGTSYFFPIIPTFDTVNKEGKFNTIEIHDSSTIRIENSADYSFWHFRNLTNSKSYMRLSVDSGYAEADLSGDKVNFVTPNIHFTNMGTKVAFDENNDKSAVSIFEGAIRSGVKNIEEGFGYAIDDNGDKTAALLDAPFGAKFNNLQDGRMQISLQAVQNAKQYRFLISKDEKFKNIIGYYTVGKPQLTTNIDQDGYYYIKIMAIDANGIMGYPNITKFKNIYKIKLAQKMIKINNFDKALHFANASNQDFEKKDYEPYSELGWIYYLQGKYAKSVQLLTKALEMNQNNDRDIIHIARSYYFVKELERAADLYKKVLSKNPSEQDALWGLSEVFIAENKIPQAKQLLLKLSQLNPSYYMLNYDMARISALENNKNQAIMYLQKEITLFPNENNDAKKLLQEINKGSL